MRFREGLLISDETGRISKAISKYLCSHVVSPISSITFGKECRTSP